MTDLNPTERPPLPDELHAATRTEHTALNRSIISRLPLCLPNATNNSVLYARGMTVFSQIYSGFEDAWDTLLAGDTLTQRQRQMLTELHIPQLRRKTRLQGNLQSARTKLGHSQVLHLSQIGAETLHFQDEIGLAIREKPHLLLAYTWTMYLALFNGGRWIAKQLLNAGPLFWNEGDRSDIVRSSLSFWFFADDEDYDGEDLKVALKQAFNRTAEQLSDSERDDVIAESKRLFQTCGEMIEYLDRDTQLATMSTTQTKGTVTTVTLLEENEDHGTTRLGYLASFTKSPVTNVLRSLSNGISALQSSFTSVPLRQEIEQRNG